MPPTKMFISAVVREASYLELVEFLENRLGMLDRNARMMIGEYPELQKARTLAWEYRLKEVSIIMERLNELQTAR